MASPSSLRSLVVSLCVLAFTAFLASPLAAVGKTPAVSTHSTRQAATHKAATRGKHASTDPALVGSWIAPVDLGITSIHAALLHTGKVLAWGYPLGTATNTPSKLLDPVSGTIKDVTVPFDGDFFCAGQTILSDGRVLVTGGLQGNPFPGVPDDGINLTALFDPIAQTWSQGTPMNRARWYPTSIELSDGKVLTLTGKDENAALARTTEIYDPATKVWTTLPASASIPRGSDTYLKIKLLTTGKLFTAGANATTSMFDPATNVWANVGTLNFGNRFHGAAVLLPGLTKVFTAGGTQTYQGGGATATAEVIDLSASAPQWAYVAPMNIPRYNSNLVILADGTLIEVGGAQTRKYSTPVFIPEIYDPATDTWTEMAAQTASRPYHSTALLLPDGTVWSAGSDDPANRVTGVTYEIFSPPYLFHGARPTITTAPTSITYNQQFTVVTPDAASIAKVALIRPGATTHDNDMDQRYVTLSFTSGTGSLTATSPLNGNYAPPGYYMVVIVNTAGVPSVMPFLKLR